jgi:glycosyltransferase 2 family protein
VPGAELPLGRGDESAGGNLPLLLGTLLFAASLLFLAWFGWSNRAALSAAEIVRPAAVFAACALYAVSHLSTGLAWPAALAQLGSPLALRWALPIGLVAQAGKYLPGNVAHYFGRAALARSAGIPLRASGLSVAVELAAVGIAAALVVGAALLFDPALLRSLPSQAGSTAVLPVLACGLGLAAVAAWLVRRGGRIQLVAMSAACLAISFALSGLSFFLLFEALGGTGLGPATAIGAFALAWAAGFVLPGAPAGLGIREAVLVALVAPLGGAGPAIAAILLHRLLTALVDGAAAAVGYAWLLASRRANR